MAADNCLYQRSQPIINSREPRSVPNSNLFADKSWNLSGCTKPRLAESLLRFPLNGLENLLVSTSPVKGAFVGLLSLKEPDCGVPSLLDGLAKRVIASSSCTDPFKTSPS